MQVDAMATSSYSLCRGHGAKGGERRRQCAYLQAGRNTRGETLYACRAGKKCLDMVCVCVSPSV